MKVGVNNKNQAKTFTEHNKQEIKKSNYHFHTKTYSLYPLVKTHSSPLLSKSL